MRYASGDDPVPPVVLVKSERPPNLKKKSWKKKSEKSGQKSNVVHPALLTPRQPPKILDSPPKTDQSGKAKKKVSKAGSKKSTVGKSHGLPVIKHPTSHTSHSTPHTSHTSSHTSHTSSHTSHSFERHPSHSHTEIHHPTIAPAVHLIKKQNSYDVVKASQNSLHTTIRPALHSTSYAPHLGTSTPLPTPSPRYRLAEGCNMFP